MPQWLVVGISGVTCGGKTTLAHSLRAYFESQRGAQLWSTPYTVGEVKLISQDDYFLPVDDVRHKWNKKLNSINFELLSSMDIKKMISDVSWIMKGSFITNESLENIDFVDEKEHIIDMGSTNRSHHNHNHSHNHGHNQNHSHHNNHSHHSQNQTYHLQQQQQHQQQPQPQPQQTQQTQPQPQHHHQQHQQHQHHYHPKHMNHHNGHNHYVNSTRPNLSSYIMRVNSQIASQLRDTKVHILIIEGFLIFNQPDLLRLCNIKFHIHLPYEKCFERRQKRTYDPPDVTGYFEICVWPHYEKNFQEFRDRKDIEFLNGEISKERLFKFVLQQIATHFEERCDVACPPPHKFLGMLNNSTNGNINIKPAFRIE